VGVYAIQATSPASRGRHFTLSGGRGRLTGIDFRGRVRAAAGTRRFPAYKDLPLDPSIFCYGYRGSWYTWRPESDPDPAKRHQLVSVAGLNVPSRSQPSRECEQCLSPVVPITSNKRAGPDRLNLGSKGP